MRKCKILFFDASASDQASLRLGAEARAIETRIRQSEHRDQLEFIRVGAVRAKDVQQALNDHRPHVVHFSGHGSERRELFLEDDRGLAHPVGEAALVRLFRTHREGVRLVFLNACNSGAQAKSIAEVVGCAIGMTTAIEDDAARSFSAAFYGAIGYGESVQGAFDQGITEVGLSQEEQAGALSLSQGDGVRASEIHLLEPEVGPVPGPTVRRWAWGALAAALVVALALIFGNDGCEDRLAWKVSELEREAAPYGTIMGYAHPAVALSQGWALCDGTGETRDLQGYFIRGYDPSRESDLMRTEEDAVGDHIHLYSEFLGDHSTDSPGPQLVPGSGAHRRQEHTMAPASLSMETRPRNVAVNWMLKVKRGDAEEASSLEDRVARLEAEEVPVGAILGYVGLVSELGDRWRVCDGTNGAPDLRGYFLRGWDPYCELVREEREGGLLGAQPDAIGPHSHTYVAVLPGGPAEAGSRYAVDPRSFQQWNHFDPHATQIDTSARETRPRNVAVVWIIKVEDSRPDGGCLAQRVERLARGVVPVGSIAAYQHESLATEGAWLSCCTESALSANTSTYPTLSRMLTSESGPSLTFVLPDLKGLCMRGLDPQGAVDPEGRDRHVLQIQLPSIGPHRHSYEALTRNDGMDGIDNEIEPRHPGLQEVRGARTLLTLNPDGSPRDDETRPASVAANLIIKSGLPAASGN